MNIHELMIGNYIQDMEGNIYKTFSFSSILIQCDKIEGGSHIFEDEEVKPIPLTEEWLIKFGFSEIEEKLYCRRWRLNRVDIYRMVSGKYPFYFRFNQVDLKIKYVHQLQNLYFVLTGEKLKLKE